jgi:predicted MPP superfamily phosphohydrolase
MLIHFPNNLTAQIASDLHLPHWRHRQGHPLHFVIEPKADLLILAGDLCNGVPCEEDRRWLQTLSDLADWPSGIVLVLGNHDHYGTDLDRVAHEWRKALSGTRIQILDRDVIPVGGLRIAGCTLWTDFDRGSPLLPFHAQQTLADYRHLVKDGRLARPSDILYAHYRDLNWLLDLPPGSPDSPLVVVTHHAPSWNSVQPDRIGDPLNGAYVSASEWVAEQIRPAIWVHGHVHARFDYLLHDTTRVVCNPVGYFGETVLDARASRHAGARKDLTAQPMGS